MGCVLHSHDIVHVAGVGVHNLPPYVLSVSELQTHPLKPVANSEPCVAVMCDPQVNYSVTACSYQVIVFTLCLVRPLAPFVVDEAFQCVRSSFFQKQKQ